MLINQNWVYISFTKKNLTKKNLKLKSTQRAAVDKWIRWIRATKSKDSTFCNLYLLLNSVNSNSFHKPRTVSTQCSLTMWSIWTKCKIIEEKYFRKKLLIVNEEILFWLTGKELSLTGTLLITTEKSENIAQFSRPAFEIMTHKQTETAL